MSTRHSRVAASGARFTCAGMHSSQQSIRVVVSSAAEAGTPSEACTSVPRAVDESRPVTRTESWLCVTYDSRPGSSTMLPALPRARAIAARSDSVGCPVMGAAWGAAVLLDCGFVGVGAEFVGVGARVRSAARRKLSSLRTMPTRFFVDRAFIVRLR